MEIRHRRSYLPLDLRADSAYAIDSDRCLNWRMIEMDPRRKTGFLGDRVMCALAFG
jgi:hypothetical protein